MGDGLERQRREDSLGTCARWWTCASSFTLTTAHAPPGSIMTPILERLASHLRGVAHDPLLAIQRHSGFPLCLLPDDLPTNDARYWWTPTNVAVLCVSPNVTDEAALQRLALAHMYGLEQIARGLPLRAATSEIDALRVSEFCLAGVALVRGYPGFAATHGATVPYLPAEAAGHVASLGPAIASGSPEALMLPQFRMAAVLTLGGLPGPYEPEVVPWLRNRWPELAEHVATITGGSPLQAANAAWKWTRDVPTTPPWVFAPAQEARVTRPSVKILGTRAGGVLATDKVNTKGAQFMPVALAKLAQDALRLRVMYEDHDRSRPPSALILDARYHCHGDEHMVTVDVAAMSQVGEDRLARGGGFSPAMHLV